MRQHNRGLSFFVLATQEGLGSWMCLKLATVLGRVAESRVCGVQAPWVRLVNPLCEVEEKCCD